MKDVLIVFFVLSLIMLMLVFPFKSRLMGHFNLIEKKGFYSFKVWRIKLLCGRVFINERNEFIIENTNNAIKNRYKDEFMKKFASQLLKSIDVKKVELFFTGGFQNNSFSSAMLCGSATLLVSVIYSYLSLNYEDVHLFEDVSPIFDDNVFELTFDFVVSISIFQIIKSLINAKLLLSKERRV